MGRNLKKELLDKVKSTSKKIDLDSGEPLRRAILRVQRAKFLMQMGLISPCVPDGAAVAPITDNSTFIMEEKKVCPKCGRELTLDNFYVKTTPDGIRVPRNQCKECYKEYMRGYSARRREKREAEKLAKATKEALPTTMSEEVLLEFLAKVQPRILLKSLYERGYRGNLQVEVREVKTISLEHLFNE